MAEPAAGHAVGARPMSAPHWRGARGHPSRHHGQADTRTPATAGRADAPPVWTPSARDTYEALLRDGLGPRLRALGFRGSGTAFRWPREGWLVQLGVQRSRDSTRQRVLFTINLSAVPVVRWEQARAADPRLPKVPSANVCYGPGSDVVVADQVVVPRTGGRLVGTASRRRLVGARRPDRGRRRGLRRPGASPRRRRRRHRPRRSAKTRAVMRRLRQRHWILRTVPVCASVAARCRRRPTDQWGNHE